MDRIDFNGRSQSILKPALVNSKFPNDLSFQPSPMEGYRNLSGSDTDSWYALRDWEEKTDNRLFWRGSSTGGFNVQRDWKDSHRFRLHLMVNGPKGGDVWWAQQSRDVIMPKGNGGYESVRRWDRVLSKAYVDVKLAGKLVGVSDLPNEPRKLTCRCPMNIRSSARRSCARSNGVPKSGLSKLPPSNTHLMSMVTDGRNVSIVCSPRVAPFSSLPCSQSGTWNV